MSIVKNNNSGSFLKERDIERETLDRYAEDMEKKRILNMNFSMADMNGNLYWYDKGIRVQMNREAVSNSLRDPKKRAIALATMYPVIVASVDREAKTIYVSHIDAKEQKRKELLAILDEAIENDKPVTENVRVVKIKGEKGSSHVIVDIGGVGITGIIRMRDWSSVYTDNISLVTKPGAILKVVVKKHIMWDGKSAYGCSRAEALTRDPWEGIEERLPKGTFVNVLCVGKRAKNFYGMIEGIEEINAYCEYPDKDKGIDIVEGMKYQGYVAAVSEEKKLLRVRINSLLK